MLINVVQYSDEPDMTDEPGLFILRDYWLSLEKNQPLEMKVIYYRYLDEIERDAEEKWTNRERAFIDLRLLKDWQMKNWHTRTTDSLYSELLKKFQDKKFIVGSENLFSQLLKNEARFNITYNYRRYYV